MAREIEALHPLLQEKIKQLMDACAAQRLSIGISECVRTVEEQDKLYASGRTIPGSIITNAKGNTYSSMHQWGVAFDFYRADGKGAYIDTDNFFTKVGKIGQNIGLEWGGAWKKIVDKPHFQLSDWGSTASKLKNLYGTPTKFMKLWDQDSPIIVVEKTTMEVTKQNIKILQAWVGTKADGAWGKHSRKCMINKIQFALNLQETGRLSKNLLNNIGVKKEGHTGLLVQCLEGLLFVHGYNCQHFGGNFTETVGDCVEQFQRDSGLVVDRKAGKNTFTALLGTKNQPVI